MRTKSAAGRRCAVALALLVCGETTTVFAQEPLQLTIGQAARLAAERSAVTAVARSRAAAADARVMQRRSALLPNVTAFAERAGREFNTATLGLNLPSLPGQPPLFDPDGEVRGPVATLELRTRLVLNLFDLSAIRWVRSARASAAASEVEVAVAEERAAALGAAAYIEAAGAYALVKAREADRELVEDLLVIARAQLDAGVGVALDVTRAEAQLASVEARLVATRSRRDQARLDLLRALDLPFDREVAFGDSLASPTPVPAADDAEAAVVPALLRRPALQAARRRLEAARQESRAIRAGGLPSVSLFVDDGFIGADPAHLLNTYTWGLRVSVPLFDGLNRRGEAEERRALADEAEATLADLQEEVAYQVRKAVLALRSAEEQVAAARKRVALAELEVEQASERFRSGVAGNADVIFASMGLSAARTELVEALAARLAASVGLAVAEGSIITLP